MQFGREWTKFAVRFREVSSLESVRLEKVDCIIYHIYQKGSWYPVMSSTYGFTDDKGIQVFKSSPILVR